MASSQIVSLSFGCYVSFLFANWRMHTAHIYWRLKILLLFCCFHFCIVKQMNWNEMNKCSLKNKQDMQNVNSALARLTTQYYERSKIQNVNNSVERLYFESDMFAGCRITLHTYVCLMRIAFRWPVCPFVHSAVYPFIFIKTTVMRLFFVSFTHSNCLCNWHKHINDLLLWIWWVKIALFFFFEWICHFVPV